MPRIALVRLKLIELRHLVEFTEKALQSSLGNLRLGLGELERNSLPEDSVEDHRDILVEIWRVEDSFTQALRRSLFVSAYALAEEDFVAACHDIEREQQSAVKLNDMRGSGIRRAASFLTKVGGLDLPLESDAWKQILHFGQVRNAIVHGGSWVRDNENGNALRRVGDLPGITVTRGEILLAPEWIETFAIAVNQFWNQVMVGQRDSRST